MRSTSETFSMLGVGWKSSSASSGPTPRASVSVASEWSASVANARGNSIPNTTNYRLEDFEDLGPIGHGSFGDVRKVMDRSKGTAFALKVIAKEKLEKHEMRGYLEREVRTQLRLRHPNILTLHQRLEDSKSIHLLLELAVGGSLYQALARSPGRRFSADRAASTFAQVSSALHFLHRNDVVHRDVKPENILICEGDVAKLADFGWCAEVAVDASSGRQTFCGTFDYLSPEMLRGDPHGVGVDIWALGVLLFEMLEGKAPFAARSQADCFQNILKVNFSVSSAPASAADLIGRLLVRDPSQRIGLAAALQHPFAAAALPSADDDHLGRDGGRGQDDGMAASAAAEAHAPQESVLSKSSTLSQESAWQKSGHYDAVKNFSRKNSAHRELANELDETCAAGGEGGGGFSFSRLPEARRASATTSNTTTTATTAATATMTVTPAAPPHRSLAGAWEGARASEEGGGTTNRENSSSKNNNAIGLGEAGAQQAQANNASSLTSGLCSSRLSRATLLSRSESLTSSASRQTNSTTRCWAEPRKPSPIRIDWMHIGGKADDSAPVGAPETTREQARTVNKTYLETPDICSEEEDIISPIGRIGKLSA